MSYIYRGPWQWITDATGEYWGVPWSVGCIDLRSLVEQSQLGGTPGLGLFLSNSPVADSNYDLLGIGNWRDIKPNQRTKDAIPKRRGYTLKGDDLLGNVLDILTDGADPTGQEFAKPLMPTSSGRIELSLGGMRHTERFIIGRMHTARILETYRIDVEDVFNAAKAGKTRDPDIHRKMLDSLCEKYGTDDWQQFVPAELHKEIPGRLKHETTITDSFDRANADALGTSSEGWSWTETAGDIDIVSNAAASQTAGVENIARAESDLSSSDMYSQAAVSGNNPGVSARYSASAKTYYFAQWVSVLGWLIRKYVSGAFTEVSSASASATPATIRLECDGSSIKLLRNGVSIVTATDTAISGNLRCGLHSFGTGNTWSDFEAGDLTATGVTYTQLERSTRGIMRGVYTTRF